jgi:hypothetical protein
MKKLIRRLKKRLLKNSKHELIIVQHDAESLTDALGIDSIRYSVLEQNCIYSAQHSSSLASCFEKIIQKCDNTNELVFSIHLFDKMIERHLAEARMYNPN